MKQSLSIVSKIILLFFIFPIHSFAQQGKQNYYYKSMIDLGFSPISLIDPTHSQIRIGWDFYFNDEISFDIDMGYGFTQLHNILYSQGKFEKFNYFQLRPQLKYYAVSKQTFKFYIGLEYFYMYEKNVLKPNQLQVEYGLQEMGILSFSKADYLKTKKGLNINFGFKFYSRTLFFYEIYFGGGVFSKNVEITNFQNAVYYPNKKIEYPLVEHDVLLPNITLGLKIGLKFLYRLEKLD